MSIAPFTPCNHCGVTVPKDSWVVHNGDERSTLLHEKCTRAWAKKHGMTYIESEYTPYVKPRSWKEISNDAFNALCVVVTIAALIVVPYNCAFNKMC